MRLIWIRVDGYRRFSDAQTLKLDSKLVALVGPNEAGKTSLLNAIHHLGNDNPIRPGELTRSREPAEDVIVGSYLLGQEDVEELGDLEGGDAVRWLRVFKGAGGTRRVELEPDLVRDPRPRRRLLRDLDRAAKHSLVLNLDTADELVSLLERTLAALDAAPEQTAGGARKLLSQTMNALTAAEFTEGPKYLVGLPRKIEEFLAVESTPLPRTAARDRLMERLPTIALFDDDARDLSSAYELASVTDSPGAALENLADVADLDLSALLAAGQSGNLAQINTLQTRANGKLASAFGEGWRQSSVRVEFMVNAGTLHVQIRDEADEFSGLDERSDGLRQFVALMAFCLRSQIESPILLIDEAESRLHYDAQADLVDMLARQQLARQVIYTTHSMGCLPEEFGSGIRLVKLVEDKPWSTVENRFWSEAEVGLASVFFGMGATTLAFFPVRAALLVEGSSDLILLPRMVKEATGRDYVGFQVVPGLSEASRAQIPALARHGSQVLYLVDRDDGGAELSKFLTEAGISRDDIFPISRGSTPVEEIEDLLDPVVLARAVNRYNETWSPEAAEISAASLRTSPRFEAVEKACARTGAIAPGKVDLAYAVLSVVLEEPGLEVVDPKRMKGFRKTVEQISRRFEALRTTAAS